MHEANTPLARRVDHVAKGQACVIAKAEMPLVMGVPFGAPQGKAKRLGFLSGLIAVPEDFDTMGREETEQLFGV